MFCRSRGSSAAPPPVQQLQTTATSTLARAFARVPKRLHEGSISVPGLLILLPPQVTTTIAMTVRKAAAAILFWAEDVGLLGGPYLSCL